MKRKSDAEVIIPAGVTHPLSQVYGYSTALALWVASAETCWLWHLLDGVAGKLVLTLLFLPLVWFVSMVAITQVSLSVAQGIVCALNLDLVTLNRIASGLVLSVFSIASLWLGGSFGSPGVILCRLWWIGLTAALVIAASSSRQSPVPDAGG